jgi:uncharacterized protein YgiM (DUF1202 family)
MEPSPFTSIAIRTLVNIKQANGIYILSINTKENELTLEILHEDEVINVEMVKENESVIKVNTKTNKGEKHTFVYNKNQNFYIFMVKRQS